MRALAVVLALAAAGCLHSAPDPGPRDGDDPAATAIPAPWWPVGSWWDVRLQHAGNSGEVRVVNFLNASDHFWLGLSDRNAAMDHALHDTNALLGRIHWGILTPHEGGIHANGMFTFPLAAGETWQGKLLGRDWTLTAQPGPRVGTMRISGTAPDGATVAYDYDPNAMWFTLLEIKKNGATESRFEVTSYGTGATGTYWFLRGRDYYEGPQGAPVGGVIEDTFCVLTGPGATPPTCAAGRVEEKVVRSVVAEFDATFRSPGRVEFVDPSGQVKKEVTVAGGAVQQTVEILNPAPGAWKVRYVGTGVPEGRIDGTGILEYTASL